MFQCKRKTVDLINQLWCFFKSVLESQHIQNVKIFSYLYSKTNWSRISKQIIFWNCLTLFYLVIENFNLWSLGGFLQIFKFMMKQTVKFARKKCKPANKQTTMGHFELTKDGINQSINQSVSQSVHVLDSPLISYYFSATSPHLFRQHMKSKSRLISPKFLLMFKINN